MHSLTPRVSLPASAVLVALLLLVSAPLFPSSARAETWKKWTTPYFTVISAAKDSTTLDWALELQTYFTELSLYVNVDNVARPPLTVIIFPNDAALARFKPEHMDAPEVEHPAYGAWRRTGAVFLLTPSVDRDSGHQVIYHMGLHWLTGQAPQNVAPWYVEGLAEVFSGFTVTKNEFVLGAPIERLAVMLNGQPLISTADLLAVTRDSPVYDEYRRDSYFYAQSWLFTHLLLIDEPGRFASAPGKYFVLLQRQVAPADAFQQAFGMSLSEMDKYFADFLHKRQVKTWRRTFDRRAIEAAIAPARATPADVEFAFGQAASETGHFADAAAHLNAALAARPNDPAVLLSLSELALLRNDGPNCRALADRAIAAGTDTYVAHLLRTRGMLQPHFDAQGRIGIPAEEARIACDELMDVMKLGPHEWEPIDLFASVVEIAEPHRDEDRAVLVRADSRWPNSVRLQLTMADLDTRINRREEARTRYEKVLKLSIPPATQAAIERQLAAMKGEDVIPELNALIAKKDYGQMRNRLDQLIAGSPSDAEKTYWETFRKQAIQTQNIDEINALIESNEFTKARERLDALVAETNLPAERSIWENMRDRAAGGEAIAKALATADQGNLEEAESMLQELAREPGTPIAAKMRAREVLQELKLRPKLPRPEAPASE